jgi:RimJ/RimL family protein N-acetyltransferase
MFVHPDLHFEVARQRHRDAIAGAERHRISSTYDDASDCFRLRRLSASDQEAVTDGFSRLSARSRYQRFAAPKSTLTRAALDRLIDVDPPRSDALGAFVCGGGQLVGFAQYAGGDQPRGPELAVAVVDGWQGKGAGTELARAIIGHARAAGHAQLHAHVLAENRGALRFMRRLGFWSVGREGPFVVLELAD